MPENTVYVGRPSKWGNPFDDMPVDDAVRLFNEQIEKGYRELDTLPRSLFSRFTVMAMEAELELRGKNLACWCPLDQPCHADVLLKIANKRT